jgi:lipid kinase YegS
MAARPMYLILNGKVAGDATVRVTWEAGDAARFAAEALAAKAERIVAGGGDGTLNEVANGLFAVTSSPQAALAVLPLGSANDFATGCGAPLDDPAAALRLAATGKVHPIDVGRAGDRHFVNALIVGFGAEVTFRTSERMKHMLGGLAYGLTGFLTALTQASYRADIRTDTGERHGEIVFSAVANGVQAGGFRLAPGAKLDDGELDLLTMPYAALQHVPTVVHELLDLETGHPTLMRQRRCAWAEVTSDQDLPMSPDGEQLILRRFRIEALHRRLPFVLPEGAPLVATAPAAPSDQPAAAAAQDLHGGADQTPEK